MGGGGCREQRRGVKRAEELEPQRLVPVRADLLRGLQPLPSPV